MPVCAPNMIAAVCAAKSMLASDVQLQHTALAAAGAGGIVRHNSIQQLHNSIQQRHQQWQTLWCQGHWPT